MKEEIVKRKIIIDCDPGIDDALAIFMALASDKLDVLGLTTVAGNVGLDQVTRNALALCEAAGADIPVAAGAPEPLVVRREDGAHVHGKNGLGNVELPEPNRAVVPQRAELFIKEQADKHAGQLDIVALGPLTNLAAALSLYPTLRRQIRKIYMMGGAAGYGNVTPAAEFNIYADPHAAAAVFQSGIPILMCGLDVTNEAVITEAEYEAMKGEEGRVMGLCSAMMAPYQAFYKSIARQDLALHDPFALACAIDESLVTTKPCYVTVETQGDYTQGKTVVDYFGVTGKEANADVGFGLDRQRFLNMMMELLRSYD